MSWMSNTKYPRCNTCGVPEAKWHAGRCWECGNGRYCKMTPSVIMEQRVYDWLQKHRVCGPNVYPRDLVKSIQIRVNAGRPVPKYMVEYIKEVEKRNVAT